MILIKPAWFTQVENILGYKQTNIELVKATIVDPIDMFYAKNINELLYWGKSPQGRKFWENIHNKTCPFTHPRAYSLIVKYREILKIKKGT